MNEKNKIPFTAFDHDIMSRAFKLAQKAFLKGEVPVGSIITFENRIIASSHNQVERKKNALCHAELQCIREASRELDRWRLEGCTLYATLEPCLMCLGAIINSRISHLVYGASQLRRAQSLNFERLVCETQDLGPSLQVSPGLMQEESADLLKKFFRNRRKECKKNHLMPYLQI